MELTVILSAITVFLCNPELQMFCPASPHTFLQGAIAHHPNGATNKIIKMFLQLPLFGPNHLLASMNVDARVGGLAAQACATEGIIRRVGLLAFTYLIDARRCFFNGE